MLAVVRVADAYDGEIVPLSRNILIYSPAFTSVFHGLYGSDGTAAGTKPLLSIKSDAADIRGLGAFVCDAGRHG